MNWEPELEPTFSWRVVALCILIGIIGLLALYGCYLGVATLIATVN